MPSFKLGLLVIAISAAFAGCGGGGGDSTTTPVAPTTPTTPSTPTAAPGTSSGTNSDEVGTITPGLPAAPLVPAANLVDNVDEGSTYTNAALTAYQLIQSWRSQMRTEEEGAFGVGLLTQDTTLDAFASSFANSLPTPSTDPGERTQQRQAWQDDAASQLLQAGYEVSVAISADLAANPYAYIPSGQFCAKAIFSSLPGVELASSGMRDLGLLVPDTSTNSCVMIGALKDDGIWQLPPTGSSSVYPYPGKIQTLTRYWGDHEALGFVDQPGHVVFVSVASVDALPYAVPGAGTGAPIATSAITIQQFRLEEVDGAGGSVVGPVAGTILVPAGMQLASGVTAQESDVFRFPTSMALIPNAPLGENKVYRATFQATVNGRPVSRTWEFHTSDS
ncbi:hypothetical protein M6I34_14575 [Burkholderiaceae bacterium FT117]|uniref:hypothetical protein n=1 Tax=Zeimonas sediminis TaxID=2944268 RepID=UPI002342CFBD|nr:hypothetical protein [Zeimonas sediminis]MCM5571743.1 hypothetical protein [Zeimonas sediminis]